MNKKGKYITREECRFHWGKPRKKRGMSPNNFLMKHLYIFFLPRVLYYFYKIFVCSPFFCCKCFWGVDVVFFSSSFTNFLNTLYVLFSFLSDFFCICHIFFVSEFCYKQLFETTMKNIGRAGKDLPETQVFAIDFEILSIESYVHDWNIFF